METTRHTNVIATTSKLTVPFYAPPPSIKKTSAEIISEARASIVRENEQIKIESTRMAASIRPVNTKRPFTPRERERTLFGATRKSSSRPPSSFSLSYLQYQDIDGGSPISTTPPHIRRLNPIPATPSSASFRSSSSLLELRGWKTLLTNDSTEVSDNDFIKRGRVLSAQPFGTPFPFGDQLTSGANKLRLPSIDSAKPSRRHQFRATASLDNLPEEIEVDESESEESSVNSNSTREAPPARKAYSSPIQRTRSMDTELEPCILKKKLITNSNGKQLISSTNSTSETDLHLRKDFLKLSPTIEKDIGENGRKSYESLKTSLPTKNNLQKMEGDFREDLLYGNKIPQGDSSGPESKPSSKNRKPLQTSLDSDSHESKSDSMLTTKSKKKNSQDSKRNKNSAEKENFIQEVQLEENAFGPELNVTDFPVKEVKSNVLDVKQNSRNEKQTKQKKQKGNTILSDKWVTENENMIAAKERTVTDSVVETKSKRSLQQTKQLQESTENEINVCKKSKSEIKESSQLAEEDKDSVTSILSTLNNLAGKAEDCAEEVSDLISRLYIALETEGAIGNNIQNGKLRSQVLKTLYKFVESSNESLLLQIARIILAFRVTGNNLSGVCKLVFKVSRNDKNDRLFLEDNVLELFMEALGSASPLEDAESCVYGYGALKFLTMNNILLARVLKLGILELMVLHMKMVNAARADGSRIPEQTSHALFQLTGALRNVAGEEEMFPHFVSTGAVIELCKAMELFSSDLDVISNISRTLSIISTHDDCCTAIVDYENSFKLFVKLFQKYPGRQDIIVRLGYALGNLMASSDTARTKFFGEEGGVTAMLNLLAIYLDKDLQMLGSSESSNELTNSDAGSSGSIEDVIIKMIRILANMSINPVVGSSLACSSAVFYSNNVQEVDMQHKDDTKTGENSKDGGQFLDVILTVLRRKSVVESEELIHSVLSTLNNLSYYPTSNDGAFGERQLEIAQALNSLLSTDNKDCLVEATRVYGNLTRSKETRDFLIESGGWNQILKFLEWDDPELLCTTVGVLVNMMADWDKRVALKEGHGIERLTKVLNKYGEGDWQLATLICQALWNYCIESTNLHAALGIEETNRLLGILVDFLDEERLFGVVEGAEINEDLATSEQYQMWEEFAGVATNLLEKMETFLDSLDSLEPLEPLDMDRQQQSLGQHISFNQPESDIPVS